MSGQGRRTVPEVAGEVFEGSPDPGSVGPGSGRITRYSETAWIRCRGADVAFGEVAIKRRGNEAGLRTAEVILATD